MLHYITPHYIILPFIALCYCSVVSTGNVFISSPYYHQALILNINQLLWKLKYEVLFLLAQKIAQVYFNLPDTE